MRCADLLGRGDWLFHDFRDILVQANRCRALAAWVLSLSPELFSAYSELSTAFFSALSPHFGTVLGNIFVLLSYARIHWQLDFHSDLKQSFIIILNLFIIIFKPNFD